MLISQLQYNYDVNKLCNYNPVKDMEILNDIVVTLFLYSLALKEFTSYYPVISQQKPSQRFYKQSGHDTMMTHDKF